MKKKIEIFIGNVTQAKQGDLILFKSHLYEIVKIDNSSFYLEFTLLDYFGVEIKQSFTKDAFLNY